MQALLERQRAAFVAEGSVSAETRLDRLERALCILHDNQNEIADTIDLHPNTVRPHLERMRDVGLVDVRVGGRGEIGRPQHRYSLAIDSPSLGLEPPVMPVLARMVLAAKGEAGRAARRCRDPPAGQRILVAVIVGHRRGLEKLLVSGKTQLGKKEKNPSLGC